jgi:hypothetical protein
MANTLIQLKHSTVTDVPASLNTAEPAYSFTSKTLFIGDANNAVINIGGQFYTEQIDDATDANTGGTIVRRDADGSASFNVITADAIVIPGFDSSTGNANSATKLETARFFNFSGDVDAVSVSFDGTANADFTLELANTGVTADTYGSSTEIPVLTIDEDGRITDANTVSIATDLSIAADTGTNTVSLLTDTLTISGGDGVNTAITADDTITIEVDNTVIRTTGGQTISGDLAISGNLDVTGNIVYVGAEDLVLNDPIIVLANNNTTNLMDIGFVGKYDDGAGTLELGLVHHAATDKFYLFTDYGSAVESTNILDLEDPTLVIGTIVANLEGGTVTNLAQAISVADGGTGANTFTANGVLLGQGADAITTVSSSTEGHVLTINASGVPEFSMISGGTF